jgi:hypothetical protein
MALKITLPMKADAATPRTVFCDPMAPILVCIAEVMGVTMLLQVPASSEGLAALVTLEWPFP